MNAAMLVGKIVLSGMNLLSQGRRFKLQKEHKKALQRLKDAENDYFPVYNDAELALADQDLEILVIAFELAVQEQVKENENA